jgi:hypothetical protein
MNTRRLDPLAWLRSQLNCSVIAQLAHDGDARFAVNMSGSTLSIDVVRGNADASERFPVFVAEAA